MEKDFISRIPMPAELVAAVKVLEYSQKKN
jgi:hypothetical protein